MTEQLPLCPECQKLGYCQFDRQAHKVASSIPDAVQDENKLRSEALKVNEKIAELREMFREKLCPNINNVDPDYRGRHLI